MNVVDDDDNDDYDDANDDGIDEEEGDTCENIRDVDVDVNAVAAGNR